MGFKQYVLLIFCVISMTTIDIQTFDDDNVHKVKQIHKKIHEADSIDDIIALEEQVINLPILNDPISIEIALDYGLPKYLNYLVSNLYDFDKDQSIFKQIYKHNIIRCLLTLIMPYRSKNLSIQDQYIQNQYIQTIEVLTRHGFNWDLYLQELSREGWSCQFGLVSYDIPSIRHYLRENPAVYNAIYPPRPGAVRLPSGKIPHQVPEQTLWDRTKQAWNNVKAEIPKIIDRMPQ